MFYVFVFFVVVVVVVVVVVGVGDVVVGMVVVDVEVVDENKRAEQTSQYTDIRHTYINRVTTNCQSTKPVIVTIKTLPSMR